MSNILCSSKVLFSQPCETFSGIFMGHFISFFANVLDCDHQCYYGELGGFDMSLENTLTCRNVTSPGDIAKCASTFTKSM